MEKLTYDVAEAAYLAGISKSLMYKMVRNHEIPVLKLGKRIVIPKERFKEFINRQTQI